MSTEKPKNPILSKTKLFWQKYEAKIVIILGFLLIAVISFEAGLLKGQKWQQEPLIIEKPVISNGAAANQSQNAPEAQKLTEVSQVTTSSPSTPAQNCAFVGSKNSNKYHLPTCRWAKQIKPENIVCFSSAEDAAAKNYQPDKNCIK